MHTLHTLHTAQLLTGLYPGPRVSERLLSSTGCMARAAIGRIAHKTRKNLSHTLSHNLSPDLVYPLVAQSRASRSSEYHAKTVNEIGVRTWSSIRKDCCVCLAGLNFSGSSSAVLTHWTLSLRPFSYLPFVPTHSQWEAAGHDPGLTHQRPVTLNTCTQKSKLASPKPEPISTG